ncbi:hypothetical protein [Streptomyces sp. HD]|uniref:hypothetical protein n=1 Tax=Streptomyces sp. HD TaxID=3020892 RepID=UPI002330F5E8|nr:hypothetical protein [Streptomyces sp. HD]MDC0767639.1 hypothetical protein [Streptomyces sp. HD]
MPARPALEDEGKVVLVRFEISLSSVKGARGWPLLPRMAIQLSNSRETAAV